MSMTIDIRGHHVFCMTLFSGHGYNEEFARNMTEVIYYLKSGCCNLRLSCGISDHICSCCPNLIREGISDICSLGTSDVHLRDKNALDVLGVVSGQVLSYSDILCLLSHVDESGFESVCGACTWMKKGYCSYELLKENIKSK